MATDGKKPAPSTRVLGASGSGRNTDDIETHVVATAQDRVVGWLEVVDGPGKGKRVAVRSGTNSIGRDSKSSRIALDFGDDSISRNGHAIIVHDAATGSFRLVDGGKANVIDLNGVNVKREMPLNFSDRIRIGQTTVRFDKA